MMDENGDRTVCPASPSGAGSKRFLVFVILGSVCLSIGAESTNPRLPNAEVVFRNEASVVGDTIFLGDVARIEAPSPWLQRLAKVPVAPSAPCGRYRWLEPEPVMKFRLASFRDQLNIDWKGSRLQVTTEGRLFPLDSLQRLFQREVESLSNRYPGELRGRLLGAYDSIWIPVGTDMELRIELGRAKHSLGRSDLDLYLIRRGKTIRRVPLSCEIQLFDTVAVAAEKIPRGTPLSQAPVIWERRDITDFRDQPVKDAARLKDAKARQTIIAGRILEPRLMESPPVVLRGQQIRIEHEVGGIRIQYPAECRQDAVQGEVIFVRSLATNKLLKVRVEGPDSFEML